MCFAWVRSCGRLLEEEGVGGEGRSSADSAGAAGTMTGNLMIEQQLNAIKDGTPVLVEKGIDLGNEDCDFVPQTKYNICYIVCSIIFDEKGQVLLIQEAKKSCRGLWYLPAGRLEKNETLIDGAKRELLEESGLICDLTTLIAVETDGIWQRYTFTGNVIGGKLKTTEDEDKESIQAKFFDEKELQIFKKSIRAGDVFKLVDVGRKYYANKSDMSIPDILPVITSYKYPTIRVVVLDRSSAKKAQMNVLTGVAGKQHLPTAIMPLQKPRSLTASIFSILNDALSDALAPGAMRVCGVLGLEHQGTGGIGHDGICTTVLVCLDLQHSVSPPATRKTSPLKYQWYPLSNQDLIDYLMKATHGCLVPFV